MLFGVVMIVLVLLASITFAMMKYIDFSPIVEAAPRINCNPDSCHTAGSGGSSSHKPKPGGRSNNNNRNANEDDHNENLAGSTANTAAMMAQRDQSRARVITVANASNGSTLSETG